MENELDIRQDNDLEVAILSCLLSDGPTLDDENINKLKESDFRYQKNRVVFRAIMDLNSAGKPVDVLTLTKILKDRKQLEEIGGVYFLTGIMNSYVTAGRITQLAEELMENARHNLMLKMVERVRFGDADITELLSIAEAKKVKEFIESDYGNAQMLEKMVPDKIRFNHDNGKWYIWENSFWKPDNKRSVLKYAMQVARQRQQNALLLADSNKRKKAFEFGQKSEDGHRLNQTLKVATSLPKFATTSKDWNRDPDLLQCSNGVVNFLNLDFYDGGNPNYMMNQNTHVRYDSNAVCPRFDRFMMEIMNDDEELVYWVLKALGYSLTGHSDEQCFFIMLGEGKNGKSKFIDLIELIFGDYHKNTRFETFLKKFNNSSSHELARLSNSRVVTVNESSNGREWDEERIKSIVGGDMITARYLYQHEFTFRSRIKLWCATNNLPRAEDFTDAFWRRVRVIPFDRKFEGKNRNPNIINELSGELSGIMNRFLDGYKNWANEGLGEPPQRVMNTTEQYRTESDVIAQFVDDCVTKTENYDDIITAKRIHQLYQKWHDENAEGRPLAIQPFGKRMNLLGYKSEKIGGTKKYIKIRVAGL